MATFNVQVFLVAKDFGVRPAYHLALLQPDRVSGVITLGLPFVVTGPQAPSLDLPEGFYFVRWQVNSCLLHLENIVIL